MTARPQKNACAPCFNVGALDGFASFKRAEVSAMGALIDYLEITQKGKLPLLQPPVQEAEDRTVQIDASTRRSLELTRSLSGGRAGSLLSVVDRTVTPGGARLLEQRMSSPSRNLGVIHARLAALDHAVEDIATSERLRDALAPHTRPGSRAVSSRTRSRRSARFGCNP